ncbi:MAG: hypothetical protein PHC89_00140 [Candidatus Pacebacteria bacterium]|nr:hypothetical protein [Candidatus Paceibacterota bacterium]
MTSNLKKNIIALGASTFPVFSFAQVGQNIKSFLSSIGTLVNAYIIPLLISLALLYTILSGVRLIQESDSAKKGERRTQLLWGIIGLFIILSIWGILAVFSNTFTEVFMGGTIQPGK